MSKGRHPLAMFDGEGFAAGLLLGTAHRLRALLRGVGIDPPAFRCLLATELALAQRRGRQAREEGSASPLALGIGLQLLIGFLVGLPAGAMVFAIHDPLWGTGLALSVVMVLLLFTVLTEHLPAVLESVEADVLAPLPVDGRTAMAARIAHTLAHLLLMAFAVALIPLVAGIVRHGIWPFLPVWLLATVLAAATCLGLGLVLFLAALRVLGVHRFRVVQLLLQILLMVGMFGSSQLLPVLLPETGPSLELDGAVWWMVLVPSFHGAALLPLASGTADGLIAGMAALAFVLPAAFLLLVLALTRRAFLGELTTLAAAPARRSPAPRRADPIRDALLRRPLARAGYDFFRSLSRRERGFRMRTYPMVAAALVIGGSFALRTGELKPGVLPVTLYILAMYTPLFVMQSRFSDDFEARWILQVTPLDRPGELVLGAWTALLTTFVLPVAVPFAVLLVVLGGPAILPDLLLALANVVTVTLLAVWLFGNRLPFTERQLKNIVQGHGATMILMALGILAFGSLHIVLHGVDTRLVLAALTLQVMVWPLLWRAIRNRRLRVAWFDPRGTRGRRQVRRGRPAPRPAQPPS